MESAGLWGCQFPEVDAAGGRYYLGEVEQAVARLPESDKVGPSSQVGELDSEGAGIIEANTAES